MPAACSWQPFCSLTSVPETGTAMLLWLAAASAWWACAQVVCPASGRAALCGVQEHLGPTNHLLTGCMPDFMRHSSEEPHAASLQGRWRNALVAVKVIDHGEHTSGLDITRESVLSTHISHPNCVSTHGSPGMLHAECNEAASFRSNATPLTCCLPF